MSFLDAVLLAVLAACVAVWPTQAITDSQNRWLRIAALGLTIVQLLIEGPTIKLIGAYGVAGLFILLFIPRGVDQSESSRIRESKEDSTKKRSRLGLVIASGVCIAVSGVWLLI